MSKVYKRMLWNFAWKDPSLASPRVHFTYLWRLGKWDHMPQYSRNPWNFGKIFGNGCLWLAEGRGWLLKFGWFSEVSTTQKMKDISLGHLISTRFGPWLGHLVIDFDRADIPILRVNPKDLHRHTRKTPLKARKWWLSRLIKFLPWNLIWTLIWSLISKCFKSFLWYSRYNLYNAQILEQLDMIFWLLYRYDQPAFVLKIFLF